MILLEELLWYFKTRLDLLTGSEKNSPQFSTKLRAEDDVKVEVHGKRDVIDEQRVLFQCLHQWASPFLSVPVVEQTPGVNARVRRADDQVRGRHGEKQLGHFTRGVAARDFSYLIQLGMIAKEQPKTIVLHAVQSNENDRVHRDDGNVRNEKDDDAVDDVHVLIDTTVLLSRVALAFDHVQQERQIGVEHASQDNDRQCQTSRPIPREEMRDTKRFDNSEETLSGEGNRVVSTDEVAHVGGVQGKLTNNRTMQNVDVVGEPQAEQDGEVDRVRNGHVEEEGVDRETRATASYRGAKRFLNEDNDNESIADRTDDHQEEEVDVCEEEIHACRQMTSCLTGDIEP